MSVGVTKDYKLKVRNLRSSDTLGWSEYCRVCHKCACVCSPPQGWGPPRQRPHSLRMG